MYWHSLEVVYNTVKPLMGDVDNTQRICDFYEEQTDGKNKVYIAVRNAFGPVC